MALMFEYKPGMSLSDPWPFTVVRASTTFRIANDGTLKPVAANVLRDNHYPFGLGSTIRTTLFEPTVTNSCLQSQTLATGPWGGNQVTVTNAFGTAPDGTATSCKLLPSVVSGTHYWNQAITITDQEFCADSIYLRGGNGYNRVRLGLFDAGTTTGCYMDFNLSTGATVASSTVGAVGAILSAAKFVPLANGWYRLELAGRLNNIAPTITSANLFIYMMDNSGNTTFAGDGVSYIEAWGAQFERAGTAAPRGASSYIPTTVGGVVRNDEKCSTPWPYQTQAMWGYTSWYDLGGSIWLASAPLVTISNSTVNTDPSWCPMFLRNNGRPGASWAGGCITPGNGLLGSLRNTIASNAGLAAVQPYDLVETFSRVLKDGTTFFDARINGGTVLTNGPVGPTGGVPFVDIRNPTLYLGWPGALIGPQVGATCVRIGADPLRITTLAQAAAA